MPKESVIINREPHVVYDFLIRQLETAFNTTKDELLNNPLESVVRNRKMTQEVTELIDNELIEFTSTLGYDQSTTQYILSPSEEGTHLVLSENAYSTKVSRRLNYRLFSLPFLRNLSTRRLKANLEHIKQLIEQENLE